MNDKEFLIKYENLLNKGYCDCNEMNCIDNNSPRRILNIAFKQQKEIERLNNIINELEKILENEWIYYEQIVFNTHAEFDDEEQVNRFWQEYGEKLMLKNIQDKLQELKDSD